MLISAQGLGESLIDQATVTVAVQIPRALDTQYSPINALPISARFQHQPAAEGSDTRQPDAKVRQTASEPSPESLPGSKLGGQQDRGYRDGQQLVQEGPPTFKEASEAQTNRKEQRPNKHISKAARLRAQRCLEDSSDDGSERDLPQHRQQVPG